LIDIYSR